jgi:hypothetical protein
MMEKRRISLAGVAATARRRIYANETMRECDKPLTRMRGNP